MMLDKSKITIKEYRNGKFQLWYQDKLVLLNISKTWKDESWQRNEGTLFDSLKDAEDAIKYMIAEEEGFKPVHLHKLSF